METCLRGFSFMSDSKVELMDLQYIEGGKLERAWKSTRRERLKQREEKIWDEFVKEKDVVKDAFSDDPYQFLDELPDSCLDEIMDTPKMCSKENIAEARGKEQDNGDSDDNQHTCVVTFADEIDKDDCDVFRIFDDEPSGDEEPMNESTSPTTVREKGADDPSGNNTPDRPNSGDKTSSKSSENVTNVIESSIYCAKVKDLRMKLNEEFLAMMTTLDRRDILTAEPEDICRMIKRSAEFCTRFNRIYMYQLQRQMHDVKRNNSVTLPFAKHTQFQSQMVRIVSLHQNLLQSFQVFHKSFSQTCCVRESAASLGALLGAARAASLLCAAVPPPRDFGAAADLYKDDLLVTCDKFEEVVNEYAIRCEEFLNSFENVQNMTYPKKPKRVKKRSFGPWAKNTPKNRNTTVAETEARLSMYSLDTLRLNFNPKTSISKDNQAGSSKMRGGMNTSGGISKRGQTDKTAEPPKNIRKSPRNRRPLMRDPHAGQPPLRQRAPRPSRDCDIRTMVEAVDTCASSHISREPSPHSSHPYSHGPHHAHGPHAHGPHAHGPHGLHSMHGSHNLHEQHSGRGPHPPPHAPRRNKSSTPRRPAHSPRSTHCLLTARKPQPPSPHMRSPTEHHKEKPAVAPTPMAPNNLIATLNTMKPDPSEPDSNQVTPVCMIQCAMKRELEEEGKPGECSRQEPPAPGGQGALPARGRDDAGDKGQIHRERTKTSSLVPDRCEVTRLLKQLCSGDTSRAERVTGSKNAQLLYINGSSPRQPSTPQLLRILEETIQKKVPKPLFQKPSSARGPDRYRLTFNIAEKTTDMMFQYRTKFVQHMLTSSLYANSVFGKPWEMIGSISEQIIDELLLGCMKEMELRDLIQELYKRETMT
ncbi:uncharacterized protein LOC113499027 isoform X3 [Trichoplusia ni]|uniref:Uncharacterized protein LOC113499027 isoform X3 n=1 Tax=Trichoplusia ni TaxID=7111 RepID=A0A7E5W3G6_TRINI|nr:uncharacterized protein LOC113499027 isoform X3 [Trichoplusia ni]